VIQLRALTKRFGSKVLFREADAQIGFRSRIALIGPNGAGKSTLTKLILGMDQPDEGDIIRLGRVSIGYLPQDLPKMSGRTVLEEVMRLDGRREELLRSKVEWELKFSAGEPSVEELEHYGRILEELDAMDEYRLESKAQSILMGMGFQEKDFHRRLEEFSGGWLMRVALSRILLLEPDLLLLDEPTNHLDLESILWLEDFLGRFRGALLMISHDTGFLNRLVTEVLEIDQQKLWQYRGNLDSYVVQKEERLTLMKAQAEAQAEKIAAIEAFVERFGAKASKARQAQSRLKQLEKIEQERIELPEDRATVGFRFPPAPHSGREVITAKKVSLAFGEKTVLRDLDWIIQRGTRTAIVGINGAGKTTLLRLLAQNLEPTSGELKLGHEVKVGYYAQMQAESLDLDKTILQELEAVAPMLPVAKVRAIAGAFLFTGDDVYKRCKVLSGGEKARVALAKLLLSPSNFLVLDEPTNHLDVESRGVLLEALAHYTGTLCLVSHDREFVSGLVDQVLEVVPGEKGSEVHRLVGGYEDYLSRKTREIAGAAELSRAKWQADKKQSAPAAPKESGNSEGVKRPSNNQLRSWERERDQAEKDITRLESEQAKLQEKLALPETYENKALTLQLIEEQRKITESLHALLNRWEELCGLLG
jgi:ATP-binding cassette subfamily F protein 3